MKNPHLSAVKLSAEFNESTSISPETVQRVLRMAGLHGSSTRIFFFFFLSEKNRKLRLSFLKSIINKPERCLNKILFSDENKFNIF